MGKLTELIKRHWVVALTLVVAIVGGVPGFLSIYEYYTDRPKVVLSLLRVDYGKLKWPDNPNEYSYLLLELEVTNEEEYSIPLPSKAFDVLVKIDSKWINFEKMAIPLSGTVLYSSEKDKTGANIDHMDLQKFRELNVSRLYGNYLPSTRKSDQYLGSNHFLLSLISDVSLEELGKTFTQATFQEDNPIKITWQNVRGRSNNSYLVVHDSPKITTNCYRVYSQKVKYF